MSPILQIPPVVQMSTLVTRAWYDIMLLSNMINVMQVLPSVKIKRDWKKFSKDISQYFILGPLILHIFMNDLFLPDSIRKCV